MAQKNDKDFFNIGELSRRHTLFSKECGERAISPKFGVEDARLMHLEMLSWQCNIQLAMAQQLAMVAKHLGEIVAKSKNES